MPLFGVDLPHLDGPVTHKIDFDFLPFVIVAAGIAIGVFWSGRRKNLEVKSAEPKSANMGPRNSGFRKVRAAN